MLQIHPNARTTPAVRAEIARSGEPTGVLAHRYGVSTETISKWRKRGPQDCLDRSARPHRLPWKATDEGTCRGLRSAACDQLRPRRPHLRGQPFPAPPQSRQRLAHPPR
jgi:hypothetical protein